MSFISYNKCLGLVILLVLFTVKQTTGYRHSSLSITGTLAEIRHQSGCPTEPLLPLEQELGGSMEWSAGPEGTPHSPLPYGLACLSSLLSGILAAWCTKAREQVTPTPGWPRAWMSHVTSQIHPTFLVFFRWRSKDTEERFAYCWRADACWSAGVRAPFSRLMSPAQTEKSLGLG